MFLGWGVSGLLGLIGFGLGRGLAVWLPMAALSAMAFPLSQSASNTIWQSKVAPDIQGRVFSARRMLAWMVDPIMPVVAGLIADKVTEPAMAGGGWFARTFAGITGGGPGSGMSLQFLFAGMIYLVIHRDRAVYSRGARRGDDPPRPRAAAEGTCRRRGGADLLRGERALPRVIDRTTARNFRLARHRHSNRWMASVPNAIASTGTRSSAACRSCANTRPGGRFNGVNP